MKLNIEWGLVLVGYCCEVEYYIKRYVLDFIVDLWGLEIVSLNDV